MAHRLAASKLFEPATLGSLRLPNALVMAQMTRTPALPGGTPSPSMATYDALAAWRCDRHGRSRPPRRSLGRPATRRVNERRVTPWRTNRWDPGNRAGC
jgi:hypothetical protein